jgi:uroporphyrinogen-III synthase
VSFVVVRPAPGDAATVARIRALGFAAESIPLFAVGPVAWVAPDAAGFDALLLTSANAVRHGGAALMRFAPLPVVAVGEATARAARAAGFVVAVTGAADVEAAIGAARSDGFARLLHLAGRDRVGSAATAVTVYASDALPVAAGAARRFEARTVLLHSARAAARVADLVDRDGADRGRIRLAAISAAVAAAAGGGVRGGWADVAIAERPTDSALIERAIDRSAARRDK